MSVLSPTIQHAVAGRAVAGQTTYTMSERYWLTTGAGLDWIPFSSAGTRANITAEAELWPGTLPLVARSDTPGLLTVSSTSAADGPAGAGAHLVLVEYIDDDGWERFGVATLPGAAATPVPVTQHTRLSEELGSQTAEVSGSPQASGTRINRSYVIALGSAGTAYTAANVGLVSTFIAGVENDAMRVGTNLASCSCVTVPRGRFGFLDALSVSGDTTVSSTSRIYVKALGLPRIDFATLNVGTQPLPTPLPLPVRLQPRTDLIFTGERTGGGQLEASGTFQVVLAPNPNDLDQEPLLQPPRLT